MMTTIRLACIVFELFMSMHSVEGTLPKSVYKTVKSGQNITGIIKIQLKTRTKLECSTRCTIEEGCTAYRFNSKRRNCVLISEDSTQMTFLPSQEGQLYTKDECYSKPCQNGGTCIDGAMMFTCECPYNFAGVLCETDCQNWGCSHVVYRSLDSEDSLQLTNGAQIVPGKVGNALRTDKDQNQYVDLGDLSIVCITVPDTCGPEGAAISLWFKIDACIFGGLISSLSASTYSSGLSLICDPDDIGFYLHGEKKIRSEWGIADTFSEWHHILSSFTGFHERFKVFYDGVLQTTHYSDVIRPAPSGNGRVVIGRYYTDGDHDYATVELDEILFFNRALDEQEIQALYQLHN